MRRFYAPIENFHDEIVSLTKEESRHLANVLRLSFGDNVSVFNGNGKEYLCEISATIKGRTSLKIIEEIEPRSPESKIELTLAVAVLKGDKFDLVIQKAVELGVVNFIPLLTRRCDVKVRNEENKLDRRKKIIIEASKQCGRAKLMAISEPTNFADFLANNSENSILFTERDGTTLPGKVSGKKITAIIGPEGGWDDSELSLAKEKEVHIVTLGGRIMRAETAAISIPTILQNQFGDLN